ncbi:MAG: response regulator [Candidatus Cloacimonadales bacterium]|jgi:two-component system chemotaxis response regulator CheY|nr:response regulator [Candidatus Cloacimonadota bacterium]MDD2649618.1 response regulator [Candidatus Cloacimonadota bacterium]MDD3501645.1 response regulator [Candidatus Cloacimonadota bacterium]MDX9976604.1 response regulator [Candidatus Cloacimonadales bacterium]
MSLSLLIVDDSSSMRKVLKKAVNMCGISSLHILEAANGVEALEVVKNEWVDLIFTDINMPQMDGLMFIEKMHEKGLLTQTPIIIITSEKREEELMKLKNTRAYSVITKPFRVEEIKENLVNIFGEEIFHESEDEEFEGSDF